MGFIERIQKIIGDIYDEYEEGDLVTEQELVIIIEDRHNVAEATAKKYIKDMERRTLLEPNTQMMWRVIPYDEIPNKFKPSKNEDDE